MNAKKITARALAVAAMLTAISVVLQFFDFPLPIFPGFLKIDFSDLPAIIAAFSFGPLWGAAIELVKNLIHLTQTSTGGIGELANFLVGAALTVPAGLVYMRNKTRGGAATGMALGIVAMAIVACFMNYFLLIPFFTKFMPLEAIIAMAAKIVPAVNSLGGVILFGVLPFNLLKGIIVCAITYFTYKRLSGVLHGKRS